MATLQWFKTMNIKAMPMCYVAKSIHLHGKTLATGNDDRSARFSNGTLRIVIEFLVEYMKLRTS